MIDLQRKNHGLSPEEAKNLVGQSVRFEVQLSISDLIGKDIEALNDWVNEIMLNFPYVLTDIGYQFGTTSGIYEPHDSAWISVTGVIIDAEADDV